MPRLRNAAGVTINVSDDQAARLGSGWQTAKRSRKRADNKSGQDSKSSKDSKPDKAAEPADPGTGGESGDSA